MAKIDDDESNTGSLLDSLEADAKLDDVGSAADDALELGPFGHFLNIA